MDTNTQSLDQLSEQQRFSLAVPLFVMTRRRIIEAETREMSSRDVHFVVDEDKSEQIGDAFELMMQLPTPISNPNGCLLRCHCRLVRREEQSGRPTAVYAQIDRYDILRGSFQTRHSAA